MENTISSLQRENITRFDNMYISLEDNFDQYFNTIITVLTAIFIAFCTKMLKETPYKIELKKICDDKVCSPKDMVEISKEDYETAVQIDEKYGYKILKNCCSEDSHGKIFICDKCGVVAYCKAKALNDSNFEPESKKYIDLTYLDSSDKEFIDAKEKGYFIPEFDMVIIDYKSLGNIMKEKAKDKYNGEIDCYAVPQDKFDEFERKITSDKNEYIKDKKRELEAQENLNNKKESNIYEKIDISSFNCYTVVGKKRFVYLVSKKGFLKNYIDSGYSY